MSGFYFINPDGNTYSSISGTLGNTTNTPATSDTSKLYLGYDGIPETYYNPTNCPITNSGGNTAFSCYKVPVNHVVKSYYQVTPTVGPAPFVAETYQFYGYSDRTSGVPVSFNPSTSIASLQGNSPTTTQTVPRWCNSILVYSVGGGGGGGGKGANGSFGNSGNGADGANGDVTVARVPVTPGTSILIAVGNGGEGGKGTGNANGDARPGAPSYVRYPGPAGTVYALAGGGAGGNGGNSAPGTGSGSSGSLQTTTSPYWGGLTGLQITNSAFDAPTAYPPTLQVVRTNAANVAGSIGSYGNGSASGSNNAGASGTPGMVALFFKSDASAAW